MRKLIAGLALAGTLSLGTGAHPAGALDVPPAEFVCLAERPFGSPSDWTVVYAEYDQMHQNYLRAACWLRSNAGGLQVDCVGYMYLTAAGGTTGGDSGWDC